MKVLVVVAALAGCLSSNSVVCDDGRTCPNGTVCVASICATDDQLKACEGKAELDPCGDQLRCYGGVCLAGGCGNGRMDPGELCDDGATGAGDGCSPDCLSDETCGNAIVDPVNGEACDDGNLLDHDGCSSTCASETLHWLNHTMTPTTRYQGAMAYDARRGVVVAYGGQVAATVDSLETWEWDGTWTRHDVPNAGDRFRTAMAFDGQRIMLYGGGGAGKETWLYDGLTWTPRAIPSPGVRSGHAMAYDARRGRVVLFGNDNGSAPETWEWDGTAWSGPIVTQPMPAQRYLAMMTYDPVHAVIVMVGGQGEISPGFYGPLAETWTYDGTHWASVATTGTPTSGEIGWDPASRRVVVFTSSGQTVAWDGSTWTDVAPSNPPSVRDVAQTASTPSGLLLFGGYSSTNTALGDTWLYSSGAWSEQRGPSARQGAAATYDAAHDRVVLFGGADASFTGSSETWELGPGGWQLRTGGPVPPARTVAALAYDPVARNVIMFGGSGSSGSLTDMWVWDGSVWSPRTPSTMPPSFGPIAFDGQHPTMLTAIYPTNLTMQTWRWDGTNWTNTSPAIAPLTRLSEAIGYDPLRKQLVLFGGRLPSQGGNPTDDTWTFDGTTWTRHDVAVHPSARTAAALAWNPARAALVLFGYDFDAWEWNGAEWTQLAAADVPSYRTSVATATAIDHAGTYAFGGAVATVVTDELHELRWDGGASERCDGTDADGDMLVRCADPDCWAHCTPTCSPQATCASTEPNCGDGTCDPFHESCHTCPGDCATCVPVCGDDVCDSGEAGCPGDCP